MPGLSSAATWVKCAGYVDAIRSVPRETSPAAEEGTAAHWCAQTELESYKTDRIVDCRELIGKSAPNGIVITDEMAHSAKVYVSDVLEVAQEHGGLRRMYVEQKVSAGSIYGYVDCAMVLDDVVYIWDFKHGVVPVRAEGNYQLAASALALPYTFAPEPEIARWNLRVVQPRSFDNFGPVKSWAVSSEELQPYWTEIYSAAQAIENGARALTSGPHCRNCKANRVCPAARGTTYRFIEYAQLDYDIDDMSPADLATEYRILEGAFGLIKKRLEAIRAQVEHDTAAGLPTGFVRESKPGPNKWNESDEKVIAACQMLLGIDPTKKSVKTWAQIRDSLPKEKKEFFINATQLMIQRQPGAVKLVEAKDSDVAKAFQKRKI